MTATIAEVDAETKTTDDVRVYVIDAFYEPNAEFRSAVAVVHASDKQGAEEKFKKLFPQFKDHKIAYSESFEELGHVRDGQIQFLPTDDDD